MSRHGLVLGKFYPPHAGHELLVRTAAAVCDRVSVVVLAASSERIPLELRIRWLRDVFADVPHVVVGGAIDDVRVDYDDPVAWDAHVAITREVLVGLGNARIDAVFTSETYGDELARRLSAKHVLVDLERTLVPISATAVRSNLAEMWSMLPVPVRAGLALRVVLVGAESTGKSSLIASLAAALRERGSSLASVREVDEHGRHFTAQKLAIARAHASLSDTPLPISAELEWQTSEFVEIARTQQKLEDEAAMYGGPVLLCDTDAFATGIWHERYLGGAAPEVDAIAAQGYRRLYLLTHHADSPFVEDGIRDGESFRPWMTARFEEAMNARGFVWHRLPGERNARLAAALDLIDRALPL